MSYILCISRYSLP